MNPVAEPRVLGLIHAPEPQQLISAWWCGKYEDSQPQTPQLSADVEQSVRGETC